MKFRWAAWGLSVAVLVACATAAPIRWAPATDYELTIVDNLEQQQFDVTLISKATSPLCLSQESWPAETGLPLGFDGATLHTSRGQKELKPTGSAYCPGGCGYARVEPGQTLRGAIPYTAFGDADVISAESDHKLMFAVHPFVCTNK